MVTKKNRRQWKQRTEDSGKKNNRRQWKQRTT